MGWIRLLKTARLLGELRLDQELRLVAPLSLVVAVDADESGEAAVDKTLRLVSRGARGVCSAFASSTASVSAMMAVPVDLLTTFVGDWCIPTPAPALSLEYSLAGVSVLALPGCLLQASGNGFWIA